MFWSKKDSNDWKFRCTRVWGCFANFLALKSSENKSAQLQNFKLEYKAGFKSKQKPNRKDISLCFQKSPKQYFFLILANFYNIMFPKELKPLLKFRLYIFSLGPITRPQCMFLASIIKLFPNSKNLSKSSLILF